MGERLRLKYKVFHVDEQGRIYGEEMMSVDPEDVNSPFVLMPRKDPAAFRALIVYANFCEPVLRAEITEWLEKIIEQGLELGTQGTRNAREILEKELNIGLQ